MKTQQKAQHTPGPWEVYEGDDYMHIYGGEYDHSENPLASIPSMNWENAELIAAAPALLKALKRWTEFFETQTQAVQPVYFEQKLKESKEIIAKAEGRA